MLVQTSRHIDWEGPAFWKAGPNEHGRRPRPRVMARDRVGEESCTLAIEGGRTAGDRAHKEAAAKEK